MTVSIILYKPQIGENIGAVARVMANFGFSDLRIVNPRKDCSFDVARAMATHATFVVDQSTQYSTLEQAIADVQFLYATTARPREILKDVICPSEMAYHDCNIKTAVLFGCESTGLKTDELVFANKIVTINTASAKHASMNLAVAAGIICYELNRRQLYTHQTTAEILATKEDIALLLRHAEDELFKRNFFKGNNYSTKLRNIRNTFGRHTYTAQEIRTLRGVVKYLSRKPL